MNSAKHLKNTRPSDRFSRNIPNHSADLITTTRITRTSQGRDTVRNLGSQIHHQMQRIMFDVKEWLVSGTQAVSTHKSVSVTANTMRMSSNRQKQQDPALCEAHNSGYKDSTHSIQKASSTTWTFALWHNSSSSRHTLQCFFFSKSAAGQGNWQTKETQGF